jgi:hypothetical protein
MAGFFFVSAGRWQRLLMCLAGFTMARIALVWRAKSLTKDKGNASSKSLSAISKGART